MHLLSLKNAFRARLPPNLPCGNDPTVANHNGGPIRGGSEEDPTTPETVSHPSHRRGRSSRFGDRLCMEKHKDSCICYLSKNAFRARLPPNLPCGNDPTVANHNGGPIRGGSEEDPTTPETVSHPSHRRGRSSRFGDRLCMEKHLGFRASAISQKRISCETSSKFTMLERSYSCD